MKTIFIFVLRILAKLILVVYRPVVVGITGSIGKTTVKDSVVTILKQHMRTRGSLSSYNTEFGLPLTIIGEKSAGRSLFGWLSIFLKGIFLILFKNKNYPQALVLEMGADKPGDIDYLLSIAKPDIGVLTAIAPTHLINFKNIAGVLREKEKLVLNISKNGFAILNADDNHVLSLNEKVKANVITYGLNNGNIRVFEHHIFQSLEAPFKPQGMRFKIEWKENVIPMQINGVIGTPVIRSVAAAVAVSLAMGINFVEIGRALEHFIPPPGRMRILNGIKGTIIIDDSYNSSPNPARAALEAFSEVKIIKPGEKWVILGSMLELGADAEREHKSLGRFFSKYNFDHLVTVGEHARDIARGALEEGYNKEMHFHFESVHGAKSFIKEKIKNGDAILIKGSRAVHLEELVYEIMEEPERAQGLIINF